MILGCTHYPLLSGMLQLELGPDVVLVSSAEETAKDVYAALRAGRRAAHARPSAPAPRASRPRATPTAFRDARRAVPRSRGRARRSRARRRRGTPVRLTVLGSQGTWPGASRECCGYVVSSDGFHLWLDAGTGTFSRLQEHLAGGRSRRAADLARPRRPLPRHHPGVLRATLRAARRARPAVLLAPGFTDLAALLVSESGRNVMAEAYDFSQIAPRRRVRDRPVPGRRRSR